MEVLKGFMRMIYISQLPKGGRRLSGEVQRDRGKGGPSTHGLECTGKHRDGPPGREQWWETRSSAGGHLSLERQEFFYNSSVQKECPFCVPQSQFMY